MYTDLGLTLIASAAVLTATEPDEGEASDATVCFETTVNLTRRMDAEFDLLLTNSTTANATNDFSSSRDNLTIPSGFEGFYNACITFTFLGDDVVENDELIEFEVQPQSEKDAVVFPEQSELLTINIIDNDGIHSTKLQYTLANQPSCNNFGGAEM